MPVRDCQEDGKPGYRWGSQGKCYTYTRGSKSSEANALAKAHAQGQAAHAAGFREKK